MSEKIIKCKECNVIRKFITKTEHCIYYYCEFCKDTIIIFISRSYDFWMFGFCIFMPIEAIRRGLTFRILERNEKSIRFKMNILKVF